MKKIYYIIFVTAQYLIFFCTCGKIQKKGEKNAKEPLENLNLKEIRKNNPNPWLTYIEKYNIVINHGSGIRVDLGEDVEVKKNRFVIPGGKCPIFGKGITIINSKKSFLDRVATGNMNIKSGGFAFPEADENISPLSINILKLMYKDVPEFKNLNNLSLCSKHSSNFALSSDPNSEYRHPAVYDNKNDICYILYMSAQENLGPRYCDDNPNNEDSMFCFMPEKSDKYKDLVYFSKNLRDDWESSCPNDNVNNAKFGLWIDGNCEEIKKTIIFDADNLMKCNQLVFEASASDQPRSYEDKLTDYQILNRDGKNINLDMIGNVFFPKGAFSSQKYKSKGKGYNWGNYDSVNKECKIFKIKPTCLINETGFVATTALSHPSKKIPFPCNIYRINLENEIKNNFNKGDLQGIQKAEFMEPRIFISDRKENLNCPCEPELLSNSSCRFYACKCVDRMTETDEEEEEQEEEKEENEEKPLASNKNQTVIIIISVVVGIILLASAFLFYFFRKRKSYDKYDKIEQGDNYGKSNSRKEEILDPEASFWGEEKRESHTTPVLLEKPYY